MPSATAYVGYRTWFALTSARPRKAIGGIARKRYRMRAGCERPEGDGSTPTTGIQKSREEARYPTCSSAWTPAFSRLSSYRLVRCVAQRTPMKSDHDTAGLERTRTGLLRSTESSLARLGRGDDRSASVTGAPSTRSGAATIVSSRCWIMWRENDVDTAASRGDWSATKITASPATKHHVREGGNARRLRPERTRPAARR